MLVHIEGVLASAECCAIIDALGDGSPWRDGKETAKGRAQAVKANEQADKKAILVKGALKKIETALQGNEVFRAAAQPAGFARMMINRYGAGMSYGKHVDAPYIDGRRTDLSFTVFLNQPEDYDGGELIIDTAGHEDSIKGPAGSVVLYPSSSVHKVAEVIRGERLACIGWVQSRIKSAEQRAIIFDLETALAELQALHVSSQIANRLSNIRNNLLRQFGE